MGGEDEEDKGSKGHLKGELPWEERQGWVGLHLLSHSTDLKGWEHLSKEVGQSRMARRGLSTKVSKAQPAPWPCSCPGAGRTSS